MKVFEIGNLRIFLNFDKNVTFDAKPILQALLLKLSILPTHRMIYIKISGLLWHNMSIILFNAAGNTTITVRFLNEDVYIFLIH